MATNVGRWMKLGGDAWVTVDDDGPTAMLHPEDIDSFPPMVEARDTIDRLTAENERLREACFEASLRLHGSLARHRDLDLDLVSYQYVTSASSLLNVALDHSGTLDDQTERWLERAKADAQPGPKHAATDLMAELEASIARVRADRAGRAAPSPSTGEDGGK